MENECSMLWKNRSVLRLCHLSYLPHDWTVYHGLRQRHVPRPRNPHLNLRTGLGTSSRCNRHNHPPGCHQIHTHSPRRPQRGIWNRSLDEIVQNLHWIVFRYSYHQVFLRRSLKRTLSEKNISSIHTTAHSRHL